MAVPKSTPIYRFIHVDNLHICLHRCGLHAPNYTPDDELKYRTIHNVDIQARRRITRIKCGPGGVIHDYVPFYFGCLSPMLFQLKTGRVEGYGEGQEPLVYLVSSAQKVRDSEVGYAFSDGHGIAAYTTWYDDLADLNKVDWDMVHARYWTGKLEEDMDRQRRKQAEFLVHRFCDWGLISEIGVINDRMRGDVQGILDRYAPKLHRPVNIRRDWYYY